MCVCDKEVLYCHWFRALITVLIRKEIHLSRDKSQRQEQLVCGNQLMGALRVTCFSACMSVCRRDGQMYSTALGRIDMCHQR